MRITRDKRVIIPLAGAAILGLALTGCTGNTTSPSSSNASGECAAYADYGTFKNSPKVTIESTISDKEADQLNESWADFESCTGIDIVYTGTKEFETQINVAVDAGAPPDVANISQPAMVERFAAVGALTDISSFLPREKLQETYIDSWLDMATMPGAGPTWVSGYVSLPDKTGQQRLVGTYVKIRPPMEAYQCGLCVWNDASKNFEPLRARLKDAGYAFITQTDSEVVAHLVHSHYRGDLLAAVQAAVAGWGGAWVPGVTVDGIPPTGVETTGGPHAIAATSTVGKLSWWVGWQTMPAARYGSVISARPSDPRTRPRSPTTRRAARCGDCREATPRLPRCQASRPRKPPARGRRAACSAWFW